ncbi:MAG: hypothetical protein VW625_07995, partial [Perlucidibaca sp.]
VYTDVVQAIVLIIGAGVMSWEVFARFDFDWQHAVAAISPEHLSLIRPADDPGLPWPGVLIGLPVLGFYYWATNQYIMQRVLGARSLDEARWGSMLAAALKILPLFLLVIPGAFAAALLPGLDNPDQLFPTLVMHFLPTGLTGLVLAGLIAAIMSTIDSTLNAASTLVMHDFVRPGERGWPEQRTLRYGRLTTAAFIVVASLWPLAIREFPGLFSYIQQVFSYAVPPVVAIFLLGMLWRGMTGRAAVLVLATGHGAGTLLLAWQFWCRQQGVDSGLPHFTILAGLTTLACCVLGIAISRLAPAPRPAGPDLLWQASDWRTAQRGWRDYRLQGGLVLGIITLLVWLLR